VAAAASIGSLPTPAPLRAPRERKETIVMGFLGRLRTLWRARKYPATRRELTAKLVLSYLFLNKGATA